MGIIPATAPRLHGAKHRRRRRGYRRGHTHPDLDANIWVNPRAIPGNGSDDDGNGFVDGVRSWDFVERNNNPMALNNMALNNHGTTQNRKR